MYCNALKLL